MSCRGKQRLLGRGSASWVCCWPDQLAVCLAGVWHITTKGLRQTGDCTARINPPIWLDLHLFSLSLSLALSPPLSVAYPAECKAQIWRYGPSGRSRVTEPHCWSGAHLIAFSSERCDPHTLPDWSHQNFPSIFICDVRITCLFVDCCCFLCWRETKPKSSLWSITTEEIWSVWFFLPCSFGLNAVQCGDVCV